MAGGKCLVAGIANGGIPSTRVAPIPSASLTRQNYRRRAELRVDGIGGAHLRLAECKPFYKKGVTRCQTKFQK
jgi:hypothetical protein